MTKRAPSDSDEDGEPQFTPIVNSLIGILAGFDVDEEDYHRYLEEKYLGVPPEQSDSEGET